MAHVQKRKGKARPWIARYTGPDGRERSHSFERKSDAERFLTSMEAKKLRGEWRDPKWGSETLEAFWLRWRGRAEELGKPAQTTLGKSEGVWRLYVKKPLGRYPLAKITRGDVEDVVKATEKNVSPWQAIEVLKLLRMLLNKALDEGLIGQNPASRVHSPEADRTEVRILDPEEITALALALPERWRAFVLLDA